MESKRKEEKKYEKKRMKHYFFFFSSVFFFTNVAVVSLYKTNPAPLLHTAMVKNCASVTVDIKTFISVGMRMTHEDKNRS